MEAQQAPYHNSGNSLGTLRILPVWSCLRVRARVYGKKTGPQVGSKGRTPVRNIPLKGARPRSPTSYWIKIKCAVTAW